jgi:hypothetical protein
MGWGAETTGRNARAWGSIAAFVDGAFVYIRIYINKNSKVPDCVLVQILRSRQSCKFISRWTEVFVYNLIEAPVRELLWASLHERHRKTLEKGARRKRTNEHRNMWHVKICEWICEYSTCACIARNWNSRGSRRLERRLMDEILHHLTWVTCRKWEESGMAVRCARDESEMRMRPQGQGLDPHLFE